MDRLALLRLRPKRINVYSVLRPISMVVIMLSMFATLIYIFLLDNAEEHLSKILYIVLAGCLTSGILDTVFGILSRKKKTSSENTWDESIDKYIDSLRPTRLTVIDFSLSLSLTEVPISILTTDGSYASMFATELKLTNEEEPYADVKIVPNPEELGLDDKHASAVLYIPRNDIRAKHLEMLGVTDSE